jgi:hypothetical protein
MAAPLLWAEAADPVGEGEEVPAFWMAIPPTLVEFLHSSSERRVELARKVISAHYTIPISMDTTARNV